MFSRLRSTGLLWPTVFAAAGLAVLLSLGTWQLQRKFWKEGLIAEMAARAGEAPVTLVEAEARARTATGAEYTRVAVEGRFLHAYEMHVWAPSPPIKGWVVFTPLVTSDGKVVWINRGGVPEQLKNAATRLEGQIAETVRIVGAVRKPEPATMFTPKDDPSRNAWYRRDPLQRSGALKEVPNLDLARSPNFYIEAEAEPANPGGWPKGGVSRVSLSNRHFEYAVTWYGLALTLAGVYVAFVRSRIAGPSADGG